MASHRRVTIPEIERGLHIAALIIEQYGDVYWPVFERLEQELDKRQSRAARLHRRLAGKANKCAARNAYPQIHAVNVPAAPSIRNFRAI